MKLAELLKDKNGIWALGTGPEEDVVLSSRIRLARNFAKFPFPSKENRESALQVWKILADYAAANPGCEFYDLNHSEPLERLVLVEKHFISREQAQVENHHRAVVIAPEKTLSIMVNEEDHIRLQCFAPGLDLENLWLKASAVDDEIGALSPYAYHEDYGFLTSCPTNVGTGLRASVMLHLPLHDFAGEQKALDKLQTAGVAIRGAYGEGSEASGHFYQISNQKTLGQREEDLIGQVTQVSRTLIHRERQIRDALLEKNYLSLSDKVYRAYGTLTQARLIDQQEALECLSWLRLGVSMQILPNLTYNQIHEAYQLAQKGYITLLGGKEVYRDQYRADAMRKVLA